MPCNPIFTATVLWTIAAFTLNYYQSFNPSYKANWRSSALGLLELTTKYRISTKQQNTGVKTALQRLWNKKLCPDLLFEDKFFLCMRIALLFQQSLAQLSQGTVTTVLLTHIQMIKIKSSSIIMIMMIIIILVVVICTCLYSHVMNINVDVM